MKRSKLFEPVQRYNSPPKKQAHRPEIIREGATIHIINNSNFRIMTKDVFECKKLVVDYYESIRSKTLVSGFTKYIATNGEDVLIVESDPDRWNNPEGYLFLLDTRNGATYCELVN